MVRVLLSNPNGYLGSLLAKIFVAGEHELVSANFGNAEELATTIKDEVDVLVCDLVRDREQTNAVLDAVAGGEWEEPKTLVGVSSVLTWNETKTKKNKPLTENDFKNRKCSPRFKELKILETLLLSAKKDNLNAVVVAAGIMYGGGEDAFAELFRDAWMCEQDALNIVGDGNNTFPVIHVQDCASFVEKVALSPPEGKQYCVCADQSELTQTLVVETISKGLGTGKVAKGTDDAKLLEESDMTQVLMTNIKFDKEKTYMASLGETEWHSDNFITNFEKVRLEFAEARKLKPMRIAVIGGPGAGKSFYSKQLADKYYLPRITIGEVIKECMEAKDELAEEATAALADQAEKMGSKGKGKKKPAPKKGKGKAKPDDRARLPAAILAKMLKRKLQSPPCRNKGFVLDGYPRTYEEASALFEVKPEGEEAEPAPPADDDEEEEKKINTDAAIMIQQLVVLESTKEAAQARFQNMPEEECIPAHNDEEGFARRWAAFEYTSESKPDETTNPAEFFSMVDKLELTGDIADSTDTGFPVITKYVETGGRPFNFHPTPAEQAATKAAADKAAKEAADAAAALAKEQMESEKYLRAEQQRADASRRNNVLGEDQAMVEAASLPLRKYLMSNVIPTLVDGLLDVCTTQPDDPIDYLAEYLFKTAMVPPSS